VRALAGYGDAPSSVLLAPIYALRVQLRQRALVSALRAREAALQAAESARDTLLSELVLTLRPRLEAFEVYREQLKAVLELETRSQEQSSALAETRAAQATELSRLEQTRAQLTNELAVAEQRVAAQAQALENSEHDAARAEARHKRVFIELRALEATPNVPRALELGEQAQLLAKELEEQRAALAARRSEHDAAHAEQENLTRRLEELALGQQRTAQRHRKPLAQRVAGARAADEERVKALAEIGRLVLASGKSFDLAPGTVAALRAADDAVNSELRLAESHLRALDLCDRDKVRTGLLLLAMIAAASVAYIAYRSFA
jgi:chromosome segregation ATPase